MSGAAPSSIPSVLGLHHAAYRCRDAEETRHFYEDILGLPLVHVVSGDAPSTGDPNPFLHLFFQLADGSCIAFFDLGDGKAGEPSPNTPKWVNHIAFNVPDDKALSTMKAHLQKHGIEVLGEVDHHFVHSIYFFDPNGVRLEFTTQVVDDKQMQQYRGEAHEALRDWKKKHQSAAAA
ncbi:MAG: glyoxalase [Rhizobiales bacterium 62-17]|nr:MAG: glyoxalase [Rhizobiales bacterium 62-17]